MDQLEQPRKKNEPAEAKTDAGGRPAAGDSAVPPPAEPELPKLLIVRKADPPAADTGGSPWRKSHLATTTVRATAIPPRTIPENGPRPAATEARSGLRLQQRPPPEPPADTKGAAKEPPPRRLHLIPNLFLTHVAAAALTTALIMAATATVFLTLSHNLIPEPRWHSFLIWTVVAFITLVIAMYVKACQVISVLITLLAVLAVAGSLALEFLSLGPLPNLMGAWLPPLWRSGTVVLIGTAAVTVVSGQTWVRYIVALLLAALAFVMSSLQNPYPAAPAASAVTLPPSQAVSSLVVTARYQFSLPRAWAGRTPDQGAAKETLAFVNASGDVLLNITTRPSAAGVTTADAMVKAVEEIRETEAKAGESCLVADLSGRAGAKRITLISPRGRSETFLIPGGGNIFSLRFAGSTMAVEAERAALNRMVESFQPR